MMWAIAMIVAVLVETIFILHNVDPGYFGVSLEFYKVLRVFAVGAAVVGAGAMALSLRKKENRKPVWLLSLFMVVSVVPTVHWVVRNDQMRTSSLLERGNVQAHELVSYLKDYPNTKPRQVAKWLFKQKRSRWSQAQFIADQLTSFVLRLPKSLDRYRDPVIAAAYARLQRLPKKQRLEGYQAIVRNATGILNRWNARRLPMLASAGSRAVKMKLPELTAAHLGTWPAGARRLVEEFKQHPDLPLPAPTKVVLQDDATTNQGEVHRSLWEDTLACGLFDSMAAHGLLMDRGAKNPRYTITVKRTNKTVKTDFKLGNRLLKEMTVSLYTLHVELTRVRDGQQLYRRLATTSRSIFGFSITTKKARSSLQRELYQRSMNYACRPIAQEFENRNLFPVSHPRQRARKQPGPSTRPRAPGEPPGGRADAGGAL